MDAYILNPYKKNEKPKSGGHAWLKVRNETTKGVFYLPMYLKVRIEKTPVNGEKHRDYFTVMEGPHIGSKASVSTIGEQNCESLWFWNCSTKYRSRLLRPPSNNPTLPRSGPCTIRYQKVVPTTKGFKTLTEFTTLEVGQGLGSSFQAKYSNLDVIHQFDLLKPGVYKLKIPGYEHVTKGQRYLSESLFATTWYAIDEPLYIDDPATEHDETGKANRYFHIGNGSAGCLTLRTKNKWTEIVDYVSKCRLDHQHVGYVEVLEVEKSE